MKKGREPVFPSHYEVRLKDYVLMMSRIFHGITGQDLRHLAYDLAEHLKLAHPFDKSSKMAGMEWLRGFMKRNPDVSVRVPEPTSISRITAFRKSEVQRFYENLDTVNAKHGYGPTRTYNMDETGLPTTMTTKKILAERGRRQVGVIASAERGRNTTAVCCCNAAGAFVPPQLIFARKRLTDALKQGAPPGSLFSVSENGWANKNTFVEWLRHFIKEAGATQERRCLLILDNHNTHCSLEALQLCEEHGVDMVTLPPHCSHKLQPLDVAVFGPLKACLREEHQKWMRRHPGRRVTLSEVSLLFGKSYLKSSTPVNAISGFRSTGICPFDDGIFTDADYVAAEYSLADRSYAEEAFEETLAVNPESKESPLHGPACDDSTCGRAPQAQEAHDDAESRGGAHADVDQSGDEVDPCDPLVKQIQQTLVEATAGNKMSSPPDLVEQLFAIPKASPREVSRRSRSQMSMVLTSSPVKRTLIEKEMQVKRAKGGAKKKGRKSVGSTEDVCASAEDVCMFCGEGVSRQNEAWLQCTKCRKWCHEECSGGSAAVFICDFCK